MSHSNSQKLKSSNQILNTIGNLNIKNRNDTNENSTLDEHSFTNLKDSIDNFSEKLTSLDITLNYLLNEISKNNDTTTALIDYLNPILK
jgi:hypothetical protein